jgi:hypothetical protein
MESERLQPLRAFHRGAELPAARRDIEKAGLDAAAAHDAAVGGAGIDGEVGRNHHGRGEEGRVELQAGQGQGGGDANCQPIGQPVGERRLHLQDLQLGEERPDAEASRLRRAVPRFLSHFRRSAIRIPQECPANPPRPPVRRSKEHGSTKRSDLREQA